MAEHVLNIHIDSSRLNAEPTQGKLDFDIDSSQDSKEQDSKEQDSQSQDNKELEKKHARNSSGYTFAF